MKPTPYIWKNGELIAWEAATVHVLTHGLHYGTSVFEGIRAYETDRGAAVFRGKDHYDRLVDSAKIYQMRIPYSAETLLEATKTLILENRVSSCYIRPIAYYSYGEMGLYPRKNSIDVAIALWEWGTYLGEEALSTGVRCKISSWTRPDARSLPPLAKCSANYANSVLAKLEAVECGYDEAILLNNQGVVSEGPGENIFLVKGGKIYTPPASDSALEGITAKSAIHIAQTLGFEVVHKSIGRDELFIADELFFTGTAAEITPIREVDCRTIGQGVRGPITEKIQSKFFDIIKGKEPGWEHWLDRVHPILAQKVAV